MADTGDAAPARTGGRRHRLTIRSRLAVSYAGLVTGCGAVLIALVYLYMRYVPSYHFVADNAPIAGTTGSEPSGVAEPFESVSVTSVEDFLENLLLASGAALAVLTVLGGLVGWVVAGRVIRPLRTIGAAARRASTGALDHRIHLEGPPDEITDLATTFDTMLDSLERSFGAHRRFAANASHELRTPLATTKTMIDVELADPDADVSSLRALAERVREVNHASIETVDALLDLAAAEGAELRRERVDLSDIVRTVIEGLGQEAARAQVSVSEPRGTAIVEGSPVLVRQAVTNLMLNAVRHNEPGGTVRVELGSDRELAGLTVVNTGAHVAETELQRLVEPFARGAGRGLTRGSGHGLGLAIVAAVAAAHGGSLSLTANHGGGLRAVITLAAAGSA